MPSEVGGLLVNSGNCSMSVTFIHMKTEIVPCALCLCGKPLTFLPETWCAGNCPGAGIRDPLWMKPQLSPPWFFSPEKWG